MNKQYRVIFNQQRGAFMVVAENTHAHGKSSCKSTVSSVMGKAALTLAVAVTAVGSGLMTTPAAADTWEVMSDTRFTNKTNLSLSGSYDDNFFVPVNNSKYAEGSKGFFENQKATEAVQIVTGNHANTPTWFNSAVKLGEKNDATNLLKMYESLNIIQRSNELRAEEAKVENKTIPEFKVSHAAMAMAQIATDQATIETNHPDMERAVDGAGRAGENLAWDNGSGKYSNPANAVDAWYNEKVCITDFNGAECNKIKQQNLSYAENPNAPDAFEHLIGHYTSLVKPDFTVTGAAMAGSDQYGITVGQEYYGVYEPYNYQVISMCAVGSRVDMACLEKLGSNWYKQQPQNIPVYSVNDYKKLLAEYIDNNVFYNEDQVVNVELPLGDFDQNIVSVAGGYALQKNVQRNTVNAKSIAQVAFIYGGYAEEGKAIDNTVNLDDGEVGRIQGGHSVENDTQGNIVNINGGRAGYVIAGSSNNEKSTHNNTININGGHIGGINQQNQDDIWGGVYLGDIGTVNGTVNFLNGAVTHLQAVYGDKGKVGNNAVLNIGAKSKDDTSRTPMNTLFAFGEVGGFTEYNFYLPNDVKADDTALYAGSATLGNAPVNAYIPGDATLKQNDTVHLIESEKSVSWNGKGTVYQGVTAKTDLGGIKVQGKNLDLTMSQNNTTDPVVPPADPKVWNILTNTTYTTDTQADPAQTFSSAFNAAKNTADATVNVKPNANYQGLAVNGSDKDGLTMNIDQAKNLGNVNTGSGSLKKLTVKQSTAKAVNMSASDKAEVSISNSEITSFGLNSGAGTEKITLNKNTVSGVVNAINADTLNLTNTNAQSVNANQTKNVQIDGGKIDGSVTAQGGTGSKKITIQAAASVGNVSVDTFENSQVTIRNASINNFGSNQSAESSSVELANAKVAQNVNAGKNQLTIQSGSQVSGSVTATGGAVAIKDGSSVTGNVTYSGDKTLNINAAKVGGNVQSTNVNSTVTLNHTTVSGNLNTEGKALVIENKATIGGNVNTGADDNRGSVTIDNSTVVGTVEVVKEDTLNIKNATTGNIVGSKDIERGVYTPNITIENSTVGSLWSKKSSLSNALPSNQKTIKIADSTVQNIDIDTEDNSTVAITNSTIDGFKSFYSDASSKVSFTGGEVKGDVDVNNNTLNIDGTNIGGNVLVNSQATINKANITGDVTANGKTTITNSELNNVNGKVLNMKNSNAKGVVKASQLDMALNNNTIKGVDIQRSNANNTISGTGTIGSVQFNSISTQSSNATGTLNVNGNITVSGSMNANDRSTLNINAKNGSLKASEVTGWQTINFANLSDKHAALQLTGNNAADFGNKIKLSGSLNDYDDGKKYVLINSANGVNVNNQLFADNKRTGNEFDILSDAQYQVEEFGIHQDDAKKSLYINTEKTKKGIEKGTFNAAQKVDNAIININQAVDYNGLNVLGGGAGSVMNWTWGRNLGVIDGNGGTVNIGSADKATQMNQRTANNMVNVGSLNFYLPDNIKNGDWAVSLSSNQATDLSNTHITAYLSGDSNINDKDTVGLIIKPNGGAISVGSNNNVVVQQGVTATTTGQEIKLSDDALALNLVFNKNTTGGNTGGDTGGKQQGGKTSINPKVKSILQGHLAGIGLLNQSNAELSGSLKDLYALAGLAPDSEGATGFANATAAGEKVTTGSHIKLKGGTVKAGVAGNFKNNAGTSLVGAFAEYSKADYDTHLDDGTRGSGDTMHYGLGFFANHTFESDFYLQGGLKFGKVETDYESSDFGRHANGNTVSFGTNSSYVGLQVGAGQIMRLGDSDTIDAYAKYLQTRVSSDTAKLSSGETYHFDSVQSKRLRIGAKYEHAFNDKFSAFAGGAVEREFDGEANAKWQGFNLPAPTMKGNTGIVELGVSTGGSVKVDASVQGFGGRRKGGALNIGIKF